MKSDSPKNKHLPVLVFLLVIAIFILIGTLLLGGLSGKKLPYPFPKAVTENPTTSDDILREMYPSLFTAAEPTLPPPPPFPGCPTDWGCRSSSGNLNCAFPEIIKNRLAEYEKKLISLYKQSSFEDAFLIYNKEYGPYSPNRFKLEAKNDWVFSTCIGSYPPPPPIRINKEAFAHPTLVPPANPILNTSCDGYQGYCVQSTLPERSKYMYCDSKSIWTSRFPQSGGITDDARCANPVSLPCIAGDKAFPPGLPINYNCCTNDLKFDKTYQNFYCQEPSGKTFDHQTTSEPQILEKYYSQKDTIFSSARIKIISPEDNTQINDQQIIKFQWLDADGASPTGYYLVFNTISATGGFNPFRDLTSIYITPFSTSYSISSDQLKDKVFFNNKKALFRVYRAYIDYDPINKNLMQSFQYNPSELYAASNILSLQSDYKISKIYGTININISGLHYPVDEIVLPLYDLINQTSINFSYKVPVEIQQKDIISIPYEYKDLPGSSYSLQSPKLMKDGVSILENSDLGFTDYRIYAETWDSRTCDNAGYYYPTDAQSIIPCVIQNYPEDILLPIKLKVAQFNRYIKGSIKVKIPVNPKILYETPLRNMNAPDVNIRLYKLSDDGKDIEIDKRSYDLEGLLSGTFQRLLILDPNANIDTNEAIGYYSFPIPLEDKEEYKIISEVTDKKGRRLKMGESILNCDQIYSNRKVISVASPDEIGCRFSFSKPTSPESQKLNLDFEFTLSESEYPPITPFPTKPDVRYIQMSPAPTTSPTPTPTPKCTNYGGYGC